MNVRSLLKNYIRRVIKEASSPGDYSSLAAHVARSATGAAAFIYDPEVIKGIDPTLSRDDLEMAVSSGLRGLMKVAAPRPGKGNCNGAWEVTGSWAKNKGSDGRMVYGIGFAMSPSGILMPDRMSVSQSARGGWGGLASKGFPSEPLDDWKHEKCGAGGLNTHTPADSSDDCYVHGDPKEPHIDRTYEHPGRDAWLTTLAAMEANHEDTMKLLASNDNELRKKLEQVLRARLLDEFIATL